MEIDEAPELFKSYPLWLIIIGLALLACTTLPRLLSRYPFTMPMVLLALGYAVIALPIGLHVPDLRLQGMYVERVCELGVIIALMGAGLKIDRKINFKRWESTWRLLGVTMTATIILCAFLGVWIASFVPATALLLGAAIAPTDPVLSSEVDVGPPGEGSKDDETTSNSQEEEDELRFSLTSEAGLNDGLAFPFTNMAIAMAVAGTHPENWFTNWLLVHVFYKLIIAVVVGLSLGWLLARIILSLPAKTSLAEAMMGLGALAATLLLYGITELLGGYGFIATFLGALVIRQFKPNHPFHKSMFVVTEKAQQVLIALILLALGAAIANGLLQPLTLPLIICALLIVFIVRPLTGILALIGFRRIPWRDRLAISFFGIRGIGSLYYLAYALNKAPFDHTEALWALVALVIVISVYVHGLLASPVTSRLDALRDQES